MTLEPPRGSVSPRPDRPATAREGGGRSDRTDLWGGIDHATVMSVELLAGILVWGGAGWLLDHWLGTMPWFFGAGVLLGFSAGLYLVWLRSAASWERGGDEEQ
jgi:ATP synthase protein I